MDYHRQAKTNLSKKHSTATVKKNIKMLNIYIRLNLLLKWTGTKKQNKSKINN